MYFVRDLWPVWKGGRCHSMTWRWCWRAGGSQLVLLLGFLYMRVVLGSGCNDWQFIQKINWRTGGSPTRKHGNTETPTLSSIWYHATHPSLCDPRCVSMISPPSSHFLPFSPSLLSHVYFIHPDSHIRDGIHYWITPLSTTVQLSPHVSFNIWWICFKGREGGREGVHICTHTQKWHLSWLGIAEQLLWYLGQRDKCQSSSNLAFHILEKKHNCVSVFLYACIKVKGWHIAVVRSLHAVIMGMNIMGI